MKMVTKELERKMDKTPLYSQEGKGKDAKVLFKVFNPYGGQTWYVLEAGKAENGDREIYVLYTCGGEYEYAYMMLSELTDTRVNFHGYRLPFERDKWFKGTVADAFKDSNIAA